MSDELEKSGHATTGSSDAEAREGVQNGELINVSGHKQELDRIFDPLSAISLGIGSGNVWPALAGSITVALYNGGPPGLIYEFIAASFFYWFIAASIAELASAIPASGGVYHWATVTGGRYGKPIGFFAGWINFFAWLVATASVLQISGNILVAMYAVKHPGLVQERWMVFVAYIILCWLGAAVSIFCNKATPYVQQFAAFVVVVGLFITLIVCAVMPHANGQPYATTAFVWSDFVNATGYKSDRFAFLLGMLNGSFAVGTPDVTTHLAEEIPEPHKNIPRVILIQYIIGFISGLLYLIPLMYGIYDLEKIQASTLLFPLGDIYLQVTGSPAGSIGLLLVVLLPIMCGNIVGCYLTASRCFWTLARDKATPFDRVFSTVHPRFKVPANGVLIVAAGCTIIGCIYIGNATAFSAFVSSFVVLTMASYVAAILPHLLSGRSLVRPGPFWMKGVIGFLVNAVACIFMLVFIVIFCFPFAMPVTTAYMNYTCVLFGGFALIATTSYLFVRQDYVGPEVVQLGESRAEMIHERRTSKNNIA